MRMKLSLVIAGLALLLPFGHLTAHHAFAAEFDVNKPVKVNGTVTKVEFTNPHAWLYVDVKEPGRDIVHWDLELGSPGILVQNAWSKETLHPGDTISVKAVLARNGSPKASARIVTLPDGHSMYAASPADGGPQLTP